MATHTIVGNQIQYSPISSQADAIRAAISATKSVTSDNVPLNATQAYAYGGSTNNKICYIAKQYGTSGNGITVTGQLGTPIGATVDGNAVTITAPEGSNSYTVAAVVNAISGLPITMQPDLSSGADTNLFRFDPFGAVTLANGSVGTTGKLGDRVLAQLPKGEYAVFECVSETPIKWRHTGRTVLEVLTNSDIVSGNLIIVRAGNGYDKIVFIDSALCTNITVSRPVAPLSLSEGQSLSIVSSREVTVGVNGPNDYFSSNTRNDGNVSASITRNIVHTCVCIDSRGETRWLHI